MGFELQAGVGVESYQVSGALHLRLGVLEDGGETEEPTIIKQNHLSTEEQRKSVAEESMHAGYEDDKSAERGVVAAVAARRRQKTP